MVKRDKQKIILGVLVLVALYVWLQGLKTPRRAKAPAKIETEAAALFSVEMPKRQKARTVYKTWKGNPFTVTRTSTAAVSGLQLDGILYDEKGSYALINEQTVRVGDKVNGNKVIEIRQDKVILNDGSKNFELKLE